MNVPCKLCGKKRAKRECPGIGGEICPACCGAERENTIDCPSHCEHLREARLHERPAPFDGAELPNPDIQISEQFLREHEEILVWLSFSLAQAMDKGKAVDSDAREALEASIRTYRTLQSGLIYETRPQNPYAAGIQAELKIAIEEMQKRLTEKTGMQTLRDAEILGSLVFLQRLELQHSNGRKRGRAFLDFLRAYFPAPKAEGVAL